MFFRAEEKWAKPNEKGLTMLNVSIIPSDEFRRQAKRLLKKYKTLSDDLTELQRKLLANPFVGTDLGGGKRKIRLKVSSKNKGKSGGFRVITFNVVQIEDLVFVYLITLYDKSEYASVSDRYVNQIIKGLDR